MKQVLSDTELLGALRSVSSFPDSPMDFGRAMEAAVLAKVEPEARRRERGAYAFGWLDCPVTVAMGGTGEAQMLANREVRYPLPTKARKVDAPSGLRYRVKEGGNLEAMKIVGRVGEGWCLRDFVPVQDTAVVADLLKNPTEPV